MPVAEQQTHEATNSPSYLKPEAIRALVDMHLPGEVLEYVRTKRGLPEWMYFVGLALVLTSAVNLIIVVGITINRAPLPALLIRLGLFPRDTWLIDVQLLTSVLGVCMISFLIPSILLSLLTLIHRGFAIKAALLSIQRCANKQTDLWLVKRCFQRIPAHLAPEDYLVAFHGASIRVLLTLCVWILIPTVIVGSWETLAASYATPQGIRAGGMFSWPRPFVTWDEVEKVSTGAIDGSKAEAIYVLHYAGGSRELTRWRLPSGSDANLPAIAQIDDEMRQRDVPWEVARYTFGVHTGKEQWSRNAFQKLRAPLTPADRAVFDRVYRYDR